eukprot:TRINITY_DN12093_c0_g1_i1.p1 TRINITY_DN12093_c0_g1~~TRINITY_DN12093_c0_g1_i1.p1  ORF type:complete len:268 (+),score=89.95 TRINITY_DN12093_c0_g1_i1:411-1214(+)
MNPVVGDAALLRKFGTAMPPNISEKEKVKTHLEFALAALIAASDSGGGQRSKLLLALEEYINNGIFPSHEDEGALEQRLPCFISSDGVPCAVAHLMISSGHADLARAVNDTHKHSTVRQILSDALPGLQTWQRDSQLAAAELELIQPTYKFLRQRHDCERTTPEGHKIYSMIVLNDKDSGSRDLKKKDFKAELTLLRDELALRNREHGEENKIGKADGLREFGTWGFSAQLSAAGIDRVQRMQHFSSYQVPPRKPHCGCRTCLQEDD